MYDVVKHYERPSRELLEAYWEVNETASINECLPDKNGALFSHIKPVWTGCKMVGSALTVQCSAGDNLMLHRALEMIQPGDVLMVSNGMYEEAGAMFGGVMALYSQFKGAAGLVIEGGSRDTASIRRIQFPVFSLNVSVKATSKKLPGKINNPIIIGNVLVRPGDIVIGDDDGVVVVPLALAEATLEKALKREAHEEEMIEKILKKETTIYQTYKFDLNYKALGLREEE